MSALLPKGRFSSGGSEKTFFYRDYFDEKRKRYIPLLQEMCREKIKTFFLSNFEMYHVSGVINVV